MQQDKKILENNFERALFFKKEQVYPREAQRYQWASKNILGKKILEIGCSNGYGIQFLPNDIDYTGLDYDQVIIDVANEQEWGYNAQFIHADINTYPLEQYDTIIAFEVIEHLDNGLEILEKLKKHCKRLLFTVPHEEPKGFWGEHHKLHGLNESNFKGFQFQYINEHGQMNSYPTPIDQNNSCNLMIGKWGNFVLCSVATRGRYDSTLPMVIKAIANQTKSVDKLIIFDDNDEPKDMRDNFIYQHLFSILNYRGIQWEWLYAEKKGQHHIHQMANSMGFDWVWRVDDDAIPEPNVLENLYKHIDNDVGAVGGSILTLPANPDTSKITGKIQNIDIEPNIQWGIIQDKKEVEHLHCSFLYKAGVHDYNLGLSRVAHREETLFTYGLFNKGYKVLVVPNAITWHFKNPKGGIRSETNQALYQHDEKLYRNITSYKDNTIVVLNSGLGDHIVFSHVMPDITNPIVFGCYPEVIPCRPIAEAMELFGNLDQWNIYKKMAEWNWKDSLENAYRKMYIESIYDYH